MLGASLVAASVSSIAGAWGSLAEVLDWKHTLNERPSRQNAKFYLCYALAHVIGAAIMLTSFDLINLSIDVMVMNALLLPNVVRFLLALEAKALPPQWRMH